MAAECKKKRRQGEKKKKREKWGAQREMEEVQWYVLSEVIRGGS